MANYNVIVEFGIEIEADSMEEAKEKAELFAPMAGYDQNAIKIMRYDDDEPKNANVIDIKKYKRRL